MHGAVFHRTRCEIFFRLTEIFPAQNPGELIWHVNHLPAPKYISNVQSKSLLTIKAISWPEMRDKY